MGGKTLSDAQFFAVLNANVVEMIDGEESTTKRRYFRIAENDESITFSCILGLSQQQMVVTKATKQLNVSTTSILSGQPGSITSEMLADKAVTRKKLNDAAVGSEALGNASVTSVKINDGAVTTAKIANGAVLSGKIATSSIESVKIANGAVTSEKLAPGLDVSGLFFTLPEGAQLPYTLTEEDKTKISAATILMLPTTNGVIPFQRGPKTARLWCSLEYVSTFWVVTVSESSISAPVAYKIVDDTAVKFTPPNPHRRAENAGENEHRRSGSPEYVRRFASYVGGATRCRRKNYTVIRYVICSYCTENRSRSVRR